MQIICVYLIHFLVCYKYTFTAIYGIFVHKYIESVKMKKKNIRHKMYTLTNLFIRYTCPTAGQHKYVISPHAFCHVGMFSAHKLIFWMRTNGDLSARWAGLSILVLVCWEFSVGFTTMSWKRPKPNLLFQRMVICFGSSNFCAFIVF